MTLPIYDVHTHVGSDQGFLLRGWWPYAATAQDLLRNMDACGIDRAVSFPFTFPSAFDPYAFADRQTVELLPGRVPFDRENALLVAEVARIDANRRLIPFAMVDPSREVDKQLTNIRRLASQIGGLKVQTTIIQSPVRAFLNEGREFLALAEQHGLPVTLHTTAEPQAVHAQIADCLEIARAFPGIRFNLAHSLSFHAGYLKEAARMPNVWVDCAAFLIHCWLAQQGHRIVAPRDQRVDADYTRPLEVLQAVHGILGGRYMWGSDNPFMSWFDDELQCLYSYEQEADVLHALPEPVKADMANKAPQAWLFGKEVTET